MEIELEYSTDGYKLGHAAMFPSKMENGDSNFTPRNSYSGEDEGVVFIGMQPLLIDVYMTAAERFFTRSREDVIDEYTEFLNNYAGVGVISPEWIGKLHDLGYLPLEFRAIPEGMFVPYGVPVFTVQATVPGFGWVPNYFESVDSCFLWGPITSATSAYKFRKILDTYAEETSDAPGFVDFQAHDFSMRGMWGPEAASLSGLGHLASFTGSDNVPSIRAAMKYYGDKGFIAAGVPATEHSIMCAGTAIHGEYETYCELVENAKPGIVSIVSDTYSIWTVLMDFINRPRLKAAILAHEGTVVFRPDSGDPVKIVCGDPDATPGSSEFKGCVTLLDEAFGHTVNSKGYKVLNTHVGLIYGDSINFPRGTAMLETLKNSGWTSTTIVLGLGSFFYTYVTRDTHSQAMKMTWTQVDGVEYGIQKDPVTSSPSTKKKSAKGLIVVLRIDDKFQMFDGFNLEERAQYEDQNWLQPVWRDGKFLRKTTLAEIRERVKAIV